jgi:hypothetical protein
MLGRPGDQSRNIKTLFFANPTCMIGNGNDLGPSFQLNGTVVAFFSFVAMVDFLLLYYLSCSSITSDTGTISIA